MLVACDDEFVDNSLVKQNRKSTDIFNLSMRLLDSDLAKLLRKQYSHTQGSILSGLLAARKIAGLDDGRIDSSITANTRTMDPRYAKLAFCCSNNFLYANRYSRHDLRVISLLGIRARHYRYFRAADYGEAHVDNIVGSWSLVDGGTIRPSDLIGAYLAHSKHVVIYDRYMKAASLAALEECLAALNHRTGGLLTMAVTIYIGSGHINFMPIDILNRLQGYFVAGNLRVFRSTKDVGQAEFAHDRYIQIDNRLTSELSAGLSSFMSGDGLAIANRASTITLRNLCIGSSHVVIKEIPSQNTIRILR